MHHTAPRPRRLATAASVVALSALAAACTEAGAPRADSTRSATAAPSASPTPTATPAPTPTPSSGPLTTAQLGSVLPRAQQLPRGWSEDKGLTDAEEFGTAEAAIGLADSSACQPLFDGVIGGFLGLVPESYGSRGFVTGDGSGLMFTGVAAYGDEREAADFFKEEAKKLSKAGALPACREAKAKTFAQEKLTYRHRLLEPDGLGDESTGIRLTSHGDPEGGPTRQDVIAVRVGHTIISASHFTAGVADSKALHQALRAAVSNLRGLDGEPVPA
ncbi:hypothetical protein ACQB60_33255 [Actinomycetota bacterium Odt1-20B]